MQRWVSPWAGIFLWLREAHGWRNLWASTLFLPPWSRWCWRRQGRRLSRGKTFHLIVMGLAVAGRRGRLLTPQMPVDTRQSIQKTSSMCGRRVNTCPLPSTQTYSTPLFFHWDFALPSHFLGVPFSIMARILSGLASMPGESIPYHTGWYGRYIPYRQANRYG